MSPEQICSCAAATAKSLQSCPTLRDPIDGSPPGSCYHSFKNRPTYMHVCMFMYLLLLITKGFAVSWASGGLAGSHFVKFCLSLSFIIFPSFWDSAGSTVLGLQERIQSLAPPLEFTVLGRKAFHYLPSACGSVLLTQLLDIIHTENVVQSAGDSGTRHLL